MILAELETMKLKTRSLCRDKFCVFSIVLVIVLLPNRKIIRQVFHGLNM